MTNCAITCAQDCIFSQPTPFLTTAFGALAVIARQARTAFRLANPELGAEVTRPREELKLLHSLLCAFHHGTELPSDRLNHYIAATVAVLLNVVFPNAHGMAENAILTAYAHAPALVHLRMQQPPPHHPPGAHPPGAHHGLPALVGRGALTADDVAAAQRFWEPFERKDAHTNAWSKLEPLLLKFIETNGSFDNSLASLDAFWLGIDQTIRAAAWCVASPDGAQAPQEPSPLAGVRSWTQVRAEHLNPVLIGSTNAQGTKYTHPRAALVGVMPMGFQQILALLMAVPRIPNVVVQYAHNFGFLIYRPSAAPDILTSKNKQRSSKALSVCNVEGDEQAFGTRDEKIKMCKLQRRAWHDNLDLVLPLCATIARPRPDAERARGDAKAVRCCSAAARARARAQCVRTRNNACAWAIAQVDYIKSCKRNLDASGMHTKQAQRTPSPPPPRALNPTHTRRSLRRRRFFTRRSSTTRRAERSTKHAPRR